MNIINELKKWDLKGRGGAGFPTWQKWEAVKKAKSDKKYIICNASEGELHVFKDKYILENYPEEVISGIKLALREIKNSEAIIYLNHNYFDGLKGVLTPLISNLPIILFKKPDKYIAGEETALLEVIEGKRAEPRLKPPFPTESGLFGKPTLINNVETFYCVSKIAKGEYKKTRFYSIEGDIQNKGVFELSEVATIEEILKTTQNYPDFDFFVKVGGGACGQIFLNSELGNSVCGMGSILVCKKNKENVLSLMQEWIDFLHKGNCDKCLPCREGVFRLKEMIKSGNLDKDLLSDLFFTMQETSFCALGKMIPVSFKGLIEKVFTVISEKPSSDTQ